MRLLSLAAICVALITACTATTSVSVHPSARPSRSALPITVGGVVEFDLPKPTSEPICNVCSGSPNWLVTGIDGSVWFVDDDYGKFGRITTTGAISEFDLPSPTPQEVIEGAAVGPDGSLWLASTGEGVPPAETILRVGPDGNIKSFAVPSTLAGYPAGVAGMTVGRDGNLWFTQRYPAAVSRVTPGGAFKTVTPLPANSDPAGIVVGPDGNFWILGGEGLTRMTPHAELAVFPFAADLSHQSPRSIVVGPDNNLWFAFSDTIGAATTASGAMKWFPMSTPSFVGNMASGPDNSIWFTDSGTNSIGKMHLDGTLREFPLPQARAGPAGMAVGSDGRIWFGEPGLRSFGRIGARVPQPRFSPTAMIFVTGAAAMNLSVQNSGDGQLEFQTISVTGPGSSAFALGDNSCASATVAAGASCTIQVRLERAGSSDLMAAQLELADNASRSPQTVALVANLTTCRLPLLAAPPASETAYKAQWLDVSTGALTADPTGSFVSDPSSGSLSTPGKPVLHGDGGIYDASAGRWVPATNTTLSPDGLRYAYIDGQIGQAALHVVDVRTGADRTLTALASFKNVFAWTILRFSAEGVFVQQQFDNIGPAPGLWLVNPDTGAIRKVLGDTTEAVGAGAAWLPTIDPRDPHPVKGLNNIPLPNELIRKDLVSGASTTWLYSPGTVVAVDATLATGIVVGIDDTTWVLSAPDVRVQMIDQSGVTPQRDVVGVEDAPQGIWLASDDGVYLWNIHVGSLRISAATGYPAGPCR